MPKNRYYLFVVIYNHEPVPYARFDDLCEDDVQLLVRVLNDEVKAGKIGAKGFSFKRVSDLDEAGRLTTERHYRKEREIVSTYTWIHMGPHPYREHLQEAIDATNCFVDQIRDRLGEAAKTSPATATAPMAKPTSPQVGNGAVTPKPSIRGGGGEAAPPAGSGGDLPPVDDKAYLSPATLAERFDVEQGPLEQRLKRWRSKNDEGWIENSDRKPRQAKYLYCVGSVRPIIDRIKATGQATDERPAKTSSVDIDR